VSKSKACTTVDSTTGHSSEYIRALTGSRPVNFWSANDRVVWICPCLPVILYFVRL